MRQKYLWFSDIHLNKSSILNKIRFFKLINKENPKGIFLTGDISQGLKLSFHLKIMSAIINCPIYFVLGNHDFHFSSIEKINEKMRKICSIHNNLIWMPNVDTVKLSKTTALIGVDGWYDAGIGNPEFLKFTTDWILIKEFRSLPSINERVAKWREIAKNSADEAEIKINKAISEGYKKIYLLTHYPPWKEATRDVGTIMEKFWLSYNTNLTLGKRIKKVMSKHNKVRLTVLSGHTHDQSIIWVRKNVQCIVNDSNYLSGAQIRNIIFI